MSNTDPKMTEAEWRQLNARQECAQRGHSFEHVCARNGDPVFVTCRRCLRSRTVAAPSPEREPNR